MTDTPPSAHLGPLADLRVIEMGQLIAGPFCGQLLADFSAEVIKVEQPGIGDPVREWGREKPHSQSLFRSCRSWRVRNTDQAAAVFDGRAD